MADSNEKLFSDFSPVSTSKWMEKVTADLKGADFEKKLVWKTNEGFKVKPFYRMEDLEGLKTTDSLPGEFPYLRGTKKDNTWFVRQNIRVECPKEANTKALDILNKGIDSLGFSIKGKDVNADFIETLLNDICAECVELNFSTCQSHAVELAELLVAYFQKKNYDSTKLKGSINYDYFNKMLTKGKEKGNLVETAKALIETTKTLPFYRVISVNALSLNNAGAYISQELGYALSWGNEYLNLLVEAGITPTIAAKKIKFNFGISSNYFLEIAKFRAARMLWANIVSSYKPVCTRDNCSNTAEDGECRCAAKMKVHAETSSFNLTMLDAHVNLLRTQTEAMSAALAGVDSLTVTPFDKAYQTPDDFSERIARNQQLLLKEESNFDKVVDPAAGSYYIENLTTSIAQQAWNIFLKVEEEGGFYAAVKAGSVQEDINQSGKARHIALSSRKEILLGTNQFPNFTEKVGDKRQVENKCCCSDKSSSCESTVKVLNSDRAASEFEALRLQTEAADHCPKAFMLTIGNLAMRQARAQFSCNFLACAGYEVIDNLGFETVEEGVEAAMEAKADIVVLCSSDDEYAEYAVPAFKAVNNRAMFIVAGAPACADALKAEGIENFINVRVNVLDTLKEYNAKLGIK